MKVCILTHSYPLFPTDTTSPFMESIAETLQENDVDVTVFMPYTPQFARNPGDHSVNLQTYSYFFPKRWQQLGYSKTLVNDCKMKKYVYFLAPFMFLFGIFHLIRLHRKHSFDIIHAHWLLPNGFIGAIAAKWCRVPLILTVHGSDLFVAKLNPFFKWMSKWTLKQTVKVTSSSPTFLQMVEDMGATKEKQCLVNHGTTPAEFPPAAKQQLVDLRQALSIPDDHLIVFSLGRIVLKKGFEYLIQALPQILEKVPKATVIIGGDGSDLARLKSIAEKHGVSENIRFPGNISRADVSTYFNLCDIFTLPAVFDPKGNVDGCPIVIMEAMACGKPVVVTDISGIPQAVLHDETGFLVGEKDSDALATALVALLTDAKKRTRFGNAGRQRLLHELTWEKTIEQFINIYQQHVNEDDKTDHNRRSNI